MLKSRFSGEDSIIWISVSDYSFYELDRITYVRLLKYERILKKLGLAKSIELYLRKRNETIPLYDASSGELSFISSIIYLSATLRENFAILIDEPENSLHPSWQKDYIKILTELFYRYQPKIVVATHSALIVTGAEVANPETAIFECRNFEFVRKVQEPVNIEEAFLNYFHVTTPQNRYLSDWIIDQLNQLAEDKIHFKTFEDRINLIKGNSFDEKQKDVLDGVLEIASKIRKA